MRAHKLLNYESILQVLDESGCPFCRFMKNFQAAVLQDRNIQDVHHLCNFHTWGLAASQQAASAANLFLQILEGNADSSLGSSCDICVLLQLEEDRRIREFIGCAHHKLAEQWMRSRAVFCMVHAAKLTSCAPPFFAPTIRSIVETYREHLLKELAYLRDEYRPDTAHWGVLGHAAEFMASQRGLHT